MSLQLLDVDKFLAGSKVVTQARTHDQNLEPMKNGLQDPAIFGVSSKDKFDTYGTINLEDVIMHPMIYDNINVIDPIFKRVLLKKTKVVIANGMLRQDEQGGTGLSWLIANWDKINLDKYKKEKNKLFIEFLNNTKKNLLFINKIPVIPIAYRDAKESNFGMDISDIDELYKGIIGTTSAGQSEFTSEWMQTVKDKTGKEFLQNKVNEVYKYFISQLEGKQGFLRGTLAAKRLDNVARMVANARPDIPVNTCVIPWHILLNLYDIFVVAWLKNEAEGEQGPKAKILGISPEEKGIVEYGELFDYIYRNSETYTKHYPEHKKVWIEILTDIFNENPLLRVLLKRDPAWNADSIWCLAPLINTEDSYQIWIPAMYYSPLGGDSMNTNFLISNTEDNVVFEDDNYIITGVNSTSRIVRTMDNVYKRIASEAINTAPQGDQDANI